MNLLKKLFGRGNGIVEDYDYYVIQQRIGGIYGRWEEIDKRKDYLDKASGYATYSDGSDMTLRCHGVRKFKDRDIKKQLWITYSREDIEEEIEERKNRAGRKDQKEDDWEKYIRILNTAKDEERQKLEGLMGMMSEFYQHQYDILTELTQQNVETNKYTVWQQGIHEMSELGKEIVKEIGEGRKDEEKEDEEKDTDSFDEFKRRALPPPASSERIKNQADNARPGAALVLMAKCIERDKDPVSFLEVLDLFPKTCEALFSVDPEELVEKLKPFTKALPVLGTEKAKVWLMKLFEIIHQDDDDNEPEAETDIGADSQGPSEPGTKALQEP